MTIFFASRTLARNFATGPNNVKKTNGTVVDMGKEASPGHRWGFKINACNAEYGNMKG